MMKEYPNLIKPGEVQSPVGENKLFSKKHNVNREKYKVQ